MQTPFSWGNLKRDTMMKVMYRDTKSKLQILCDQDFFFKRHLERLGAIILTPKAKMIAFVKVIFCSVTSWRVCLKSLFKAVKLGSVLFSIQWYSNERGKVFIKKARRVLQHKTEKGKPELIGCVDNIFIFLSNNHQLCIRIYE